MSTLTSEGGEPDLLLSPSSTLCSPKIALASPEMLTTPRLEISFLDTSPFSSSFTGLIQEDLMNWRQESKVANDPNVSYDIERFTNPGELVSGWDDDDVDEIVVMCPKTDRKLTPIEEEPSRVDSPQSISLADFLALPDHLQRSQGTALYRKHNTGRLYAIKSFPKHNDHSTSERDVLEVLAELKAPFIPRICWTFWESDSLCVVIDYYSQETIKDLVASEGGLKEERAHFFACEIVQALSSLHAAGIVHRDLRPENITVDNAGHIVIEGFSYAEVLPPPSKSRGSGPIFCSTPVGMASAFCAPEVLLGWSHDYGVDTWGFGVLLLFMTSGRYIFGDCDTSPVGWKNMVIHNPIVLPLFLDPEAHDLISKCLERNPMARMDLSRVKKHNYFSAVDWKKVAGKRIRAPCPVRVSNGQDRNQLRSRLERIVSIPRKGSWHSRASSRVELKNTVPIEPSENVAIAITNDEPPQVLPRISRVSSFFDGLTGATEMATTAPNTAVYSSVTLNDASSSGLGLDILPQDRMALFWESLDAEVAQGSTKLPPDTTEPHPRPRKLRKARSSIYPEHRMSTFSTSSLQNLNKLCKFGRSTPALPQPSKILDLPEGVKQIGGGIGFKYNVPVAARSKASICTNTPETCQGIFHGRLRGLGIGLLRSPTAIAKAKAKRTLKSLTIPNKPDEDSFSTNFRTSDRDLVPPGLGIQFDGSATASSSPISDTELLTPTTLAYDNTNLAAMGADDHEIFDNVVQEVRSGYEDMTLRLVLPSQSKAGGS